VGLRGGSGGVSRARLRALAEPIADLRPDTPPLLAQLVMRCLEKEPDDRPQSAADIVRVLETVTSGGSHPAMPAILLGGRRRLGRALGLYALAFVAVAVWQNFAQTENQVQTEANHVVDLYRHTLAFPEPAASRLRH